MNDQRSNVRFPILEDYEELRPSTRQIIEEDEFITGSRAESLTQSVVAFRASGDTGYMPEPPSHHSMDDRGMDPMPELDGLVQPNRYHAAATNNRLSNSHRPVGQATTRPTQQYEKPMRRSSIPAADNTKVAPTTGGGGLGKNNFQPPKSTVTKKSNTERAKEIAAQVVPPKPIKPYVNVFDRSVKPDINANKRPLGRTGSGAQQHPMSTFAEKNAEPVKSTDVNVSYFESKRNGLFDRG
jgi:hypothetical protein